MLGIISTFHIIAQKILSLGYQNLPEPEIYYTKLILYLFFLPYSIWLLSPHLKRALVSARDRKM